MIERVTNDWSNLENEMQGAAGTGAGDLEQVLQQIKGVRDVLKKMCSVSVTRMTIREAVRQALLPVIQQHRDELFPEIAELRRRLEAAGEGPVDVSGLAVATAPSHELGEFRDKLEGFEARIQRLADLEEQVQADFSRLDGRVDEGEKRSEARIEALRTTLEEQLGSTKLSFEQKVQGVQEYLKRLEDSVPQTARQAASEVEERLRKEIEDMVERLTSRVAELQETMARIEAHVPDRESIGALDRRLERLEACFSKLSDQVGNIDSVTPEIRSLGDRFTSLRAQIADLSGDLERSGKGLVDLRATVGHGLDDLQLLLKDGIDRWESDQSQMQERLTALRDSLRDQLQSFTRQVTEAEGSFWGKLTGKKDAGLKLSGEEFDDLSVKLESIIGGLESILAKKHGG